MVGLPIDMASMIPIIYLYIYLSIYLSIYQSI